MKRPNPYIWLTIIWAVLTVAFAVASVVLFVDGRLAVGALLVCVACGFSFATGMLFQKAKEIAEWNSNVRFLEQAHEALNDFVADLEKAEENRPVKEFDKPSELPFEEVRNKENLR